MNHQIQTVRNYLDLNKMLLINLHIERRVWSLCVSPSSNDGRIVELYTATVKVLLNCGSNINLITTWTFMRDISQGNLSTNEL